MSLLGEEGRNFPLLFPKVPLCNTYDALGVETEEHMHSRQDQGESNHAKSIQTPNPFRMNVSRKTHKVLVIGDSLLRSTEAPICHPDNFSREIYCLPGAPFTMSQRG